MKILLLGIGSDIAYHVALSYAKGANELYCTSRSFDNSSKIVEDIKIRSNNKNIYAYQFIPTELSNQENFFDKFINENGLPDIILIAYGSLPDNEKIKYDFHSINEEFNINFISVSSIVNYFSQKFAERNSGTIAVISSVAGDRARGSNYVYGTAKGALSLFLQGIRSSLSSTNVKIITIKPGFVDTKMTSHLPKNFLFAKPENVAKEIINGINKGKDILYIPKFWFLIMFLIKLLPESIFKKLKF